MTPEQYSSLALKTASKDNMLVHACFGIGGESGEVLDIVKKSIFYGKPLDRSAVIAEIGDMVWYTNLLLHALDATWSEVFETNIKKLTARYPNLEFDAARAINRDKDAEQEAMRG